MGTPLCLCVRLGKAAANPPAAGTPLRGWASTVSIRLMRILTFSLGGYGVYPLDVDIHLCYNMYHCI